nr:dCTP deaminase [Candidatus Sigynarchaeum springense]
MKLQNLITRLDNVQRKLNSRTKPKQIDYLQEHIKMIKGIIQSTLKDTSHKTDTFEKLESYRFDSLIRDLEEIAQNAIQNFHSINYFIQEFSSRFKGVAHYYEPVFTTSELLCAYNLTEAVFGFRYSSTDKLDYGKSHIYSIKVPIHLIENVLFWPLIGHEFIHTYFDKQFEDFKTILNGKFGDKLWVKILGNFAVEMVCDGFTYLLIGEIYSVMLEEYIYYSETDAFEQEKRRKDIHNASNKITPEEIEKAKIKLEPPPPPSTSHPPTMIRKTFLENIKQIVKNNDKLAKKILDDGVITLLKEHIEYIKAPDFGKDDKEKLDHLNTFRDLFRDFWSSSSSLLDIPTQVQDDKRIQELVEKHLARNIYEIFCPILVPIPDKLSLFDILFQIYTKNRPNIEAKVKDAKLQDISIDDLILNTSIDIVRRNLIQSFIQKDDTKNTKPSSSSKEVGNTTTSKTKIGFLSRYEFCAGLNSDWKNIIIDPILDVEQVKPNHIDLRLDTIFRIFKRIRIDSINKDDDEIQDHYSQVEEISIFDDQFVLHPGQLVLGQTFEFIKLPPDVMGFLDGRSSFGRLGVIVHATASSIDPGFQGHLTFEIFNIGEMPVILYPLQRIARITFYRLPNAVERYSGAFNFKFQPEIKNIYHDKDFIRNIGNLSKISREIEAKRASTRIAFEKSK